MLRPTAKRLEWFGVGGMQRVSNIDGRPIASGERPPRREPIRKKTDLCAPFRVSGYPLDCSANVSGLNRTREEAEYSENGDTRPMTICGAEYKRTKQSSWLPHTDVTHAVEVCGATLESWCGKAPTLPHSSWSTVPDRKAHINPPRPNLAVTDGPATAFHFRPCTRSSGTSMRA